MQIPFERHFQKGSRSYDTVIGDWWIEKSNDRAHQLAYRNITRWMQSHLTAVPRVIIDYACGNGFALYEASKIFPSAKLFGLDGSRRMLELAANHLPRAEWICTSLPDFNLRLPKADCVLFAFPNMSHSKPVVRPVPTRIRQIAKLLSKLRNADDTDELLQQRWMAVNIRSLLKKNGLWIKAEYSAIPREKMHEDELRRLLFTEAALDTWIDREKYTDPFKFLTSEFFRSKVVLDVYDQTLNREDRKGGYSVSAYQAK